MKRKRYQNLTATDSMILQEIIENLYQKKPLSGPDGVMTKLLKMAYESALDGEVEAHLLEQKACDLENRKNGLLRKTVKSSHGKFELETPRDRNGTFQPEIVKKRQTVLTDELDAKILSLYALGNSYADISRHIEDMYAFKVSDATINSVTNKLLERVSEWRCRPLDATYAIVFLDAMFYKVPENGAVTTKVMYNIMGINTEGKKDILGFYFCDSEGASFWLGVLNDLKARGVNDILIACIDGLKGFPEAINHAFPKCEVQLCVVHQIRNSMKMVPSARQKEFLSDLKTVYTASSKQVAESNLLAISDKWAKYHMALKSWNENWDNISTFFKFSSAIRKIIYTTNPIEGFHRQIRKYTKTKGAFTDENSLIKLTFCAIHNITKKWIMPVPNWSAIISEIDLHFPNRL